MVCVLIDNVCNHLDVNFVSLASYYYCRMCAVISIHMVFGIGCIIFWCFEFARFSLTIRRITICMLFVLVSSICDQLPETTLKLEKIIIIGILREGE